MIGENHVHRCTISSVGDLRDHYNTRYSTNPIKDPGRFYAWIIKLLATKDGKKLLDVACGGGHLLRYAEAKHLLCYGIDLSDVAIQIAKKNVHNSVLIVGDGENMPWPEGFFDYITNLGSLEHFLHPDAGVREMRRVLANDGIACVMLPNSYYLFDILHALRTGYGVSHQQELERFAAVNDWRDLLENNGLRVKRIIKYNGFSFSRKRTLAKPFIPLRLSYSFVFMCQRA